MEKRVFNNEKEFLEWLLSGCNTREIEYYFMEVLNYVTGGKTVAQYIVENSTEAYYEDGKVCIEI